MPNMAPGGSHDGGGGTQGGSSGGFHAGGGFYPGGFQGGGFQGDGFQGGAFHRGFGGAPAGFALGLEALYAPFAWDYYYPYAGSYGYPNYGYSPSPAQYWWYYCSDPAGYYPYVAECNTGWQAVPPG